MGLVFRLIMPETPAPSASYTLSGATDIGSALGVNQYQVNIRVDPSNTQRQAYVCKTLVNETDAYVFWTTDGWATQSRYAIPTPSSDADCVWDNSGNLYVSYIYNSASVNVLKLTSPYASFGSPVTVFGSFIDHPVLCIDRSGGTHHGRLYVAGRVGTSGGGNIYLAHSDDGATWTSINFAGPKTATPVCQAIGVSSAGTVCLFVGDVDGSTNNFYVIRSTDGGASVGSAILVCNDSLPSLGGFGTAGNIGFGKDGRIIVPNNLDVTGGAHLAMVKSDDDGLTWSSKSDLASPPSGYGVGATSCAMNASGYGVILYFVQDNSLYPLRSFSLTGNFQVYAMVTVDNGDTWQSAGEISTLTSPWGWNTPQIRDPGKDQTAIDMVGNVAFLAWSEGSSASTYYVHTRTVTFS